jgi:hypothetical protein
MSLIAKSQPLVWQLLKTRTVQCQTHQFLQLKAAYTLKVKLTSTDLIWKQLAPPRRSWVLDLDIWTYIVDLGSWILHFTFFAFRSSSYVMYCLVRSFELE